MKRILFLLVFSILTSVAAKPLLAQGNPFLGTWKLDVEKSKYEPGPGPKSMTRTVTAEGDGAKYSFRGVTADGKRVTYSFTSSYDGKDSPITGKGAPGGADTIALKRVNANKVTATLKRQGKTVGKSESEVSADGKVTTVKSKGKNPDGKAYSSESVYEKK
jgi:hypothetical protein